MIDRVDLLITPYCKLNGWMDGTIGEYDICTILESFSISGMMKEMAGFSLSSLNPGNG